MQEMGRARPLEQFGVCSLVGCKSIKLLSGTQCTTAVMKAVLGCTSSSIAKRVREMIIFLFGTH